MMSTRRGRAAGSRDAAPVVSLFSGAGGLDLGVEDAGDSVRVVVEPDTDCVETLKANKRLFPHARIIDRPIQEVSVAEILRSARLRKREAALLIGGPPCQPFSKSGYWLQHRRMGVRDRRASLPSEFLRVLRGIRSGGIHIRERRRLHPSRAPESP
jgi:DNA (cytosine-5)-methyltransferase 1